MNVEIEAKLIIQAGSRLEGLSKLVDMLNDDSVEIFELFLLRGAPVAEEEIPLEESDPCDHPHNIDRRICGCPEDYHLADCVLRTNQ